MTSEFVRSASNGEPPDLRAALAYAVENRQRLLLFSISMLGALIIAAIVFGLSLTASMQVAWLVPRIGRDFSYLIVVPLEIAVVCLFTRPALKLLSKTGASPLQTSIRTAIYFGFITFAMQMAFNLVIEHVAPASLFQQKTVIGFLIREAIESLVGASPYIPLFIGLSVLADSEKQIDSMTGLEEVEGAWAN